MFKALRSWYYKHVALNPPCPKCGHGITHHLGGLSYKSAYGISMMLCDQMLYESDKRMCRWTKKTPIYKIVDGLSRYQRTEEKRCDCDLQAAEVYQNL